MTSRCCVLVQGIPPYSQFCIHLGPELFAPLVHASLLFDMWKLKKVLLLTPLAQNLVHLCSTVYNNPYSTSCMFVPRIKPALCTRVPALFLSCAGLRRARQPVSPCAHPNPHTHGKIL